MLVNILNDIESLFFPDLCLGCESLLLYNEKVICAQCRHQLPLTNYHALKNNPIEKMFYGRVAIENATAFLHFEKKGLVQQLIHQLKYKGQEQIGTFIGEWMAHELKEYNTYSDIDMIIPVPLHKKRLNERGYNQVTFFAKSISKGINASYRDTILLRTSYMQTQTFKNRNTRWQNDTSIFSIQKTANLEGKHILLVDDVVTTGATLEACVKAFEHIRNIKISILTIAVTL